MDISQSRFSRHGATLEATPTADPRLQPTPDYGTLGPGCDIGPGFAMKRGGTESNPDWVRQSANPRRLVLILAAGLGVLGAVLAGSASAHPAWSSLENLFSVHESLPASAQDTRQLDRMKPQKQAEALLELAVGRSDGAADQISSRLDRWQGKIKWSPQIATLTTAALNSSDMRVRQSGIEVELAAYGLAKNPASLDYLLRTAASSDHARKVWALWALGLMANRGVGTDRVVEVLTGHLKDADEDSRRWAVEGLALSGATETIEPLLQTMHDDASPNVRERAAGSLAESGMFTLEQRMSAVPRLLSYIDDPSLDARTHAWASQALSDITHHHFGNDASAWRNWYNSTQADRSN
jgi:HEAT repeats